MEKYIPRLGEEFIVDFEDIQVLGIFRYDGSDKLSLHVDKLNIGWLNTAVNIIASSDPSLKKYPWKIRYRFSTGKYDNDVELMLDIMGSLARPNYPCIRKNMQECIIESRVNNVERILHIALVDMKIIRDEMNGK